MVINGRFKGKLIGGYMRKLFIYKVTNTKSEHYNKYAVCYKSKGDIYIASPISCDNETEAREQLLINQLKDLQYAMDSVSQELIDNFGYSQDMHVEKNIRDLLA